MALNVRVEAEDWLADVAGDWQRLVISSGVDRLFNGVLWLRLWWQNHGRSIDSTLLLLSVRDGDDLVAVVPLYLRRVRLRGGLRIARLEFLGSSYREGGGPLTEYLDAPVQPAYRERVAELIAEWLLRRRDWHELCANLTCKGGWIDAHLMPRLQSAGCYLRAVETLSAWQIELQPTLTHYRTSLPGQVRRKVFGLRRRLHDVRVEAVPPREMPKLFAILDRFHEARWGRAHFVRNRRRFHLALAAAAPNVPRASLLIADNRPMSAIYDLVDSNCQYNIQSGFEPGVGRVSLGYLHLGYAIEAAGASGLQTYDLLAGRGKTRDFKRDLARPGAEIVTYQLIRNRILGALYRSWDLRPRARLQRPPATIMGDGD